MLNFIDLIAAFLSIHFNTCIMKFENRKYKNKFVNTRRDKKTKKQSYDCSYRQTCS